MEFNQIITEINSKNFSPIYFLEGEEPYFIDRISDCILEKALSDEEKEFNQTILYGKELSIDAILTAVRRFPMMAERQIVVIREAQNIRNIEELAVYVEKPLLSTVLVINYKYKNLDKRKRLFKAVQKNGVYFESKHLYESNIPSWLTKYLQIKNYAIDPRAAQFIADSIGNDLQRIVNEIEKITINQPPGTKITPSDVERNIGISKEYNPYELQNALGKKDILKSNRIINYFIENEKSNPFPVIIGVLTNFFRKILLYHSLENKSNSYETARFLGINQYFINDYIIAAKNYNVNSVILIISFMREYDLRSKGARGGSTENGELLRELSYKILHN